jgi:hypothetical protein
MSEQSVVSEPYASSGGGMGGADDFEYRAINRGAIGAFGFLLIGLLGLLFPAMLVFALVGVVVALAAWATIKKYPREYSGSTVAMAAVALNAALFIGGVSMYVYEYLTEVPEGFTRIAFGDLQNAEEEVDQPTKQSLEYDRQAVFLKGYIHPLSGSGQLRQFILIPDLGTCCFGGQPKSTDMVEVTLTGGQTVTYSMTKIKLAGKFSVKATAAKDFDNPVYYRLDGDVCN